MGASYSQSATLSFNGGVQQLRACDRVAIASFGIHSGAAFAAVIGLVNVAVWLGRKYYPAQGQGA